ncbi:MAG: SDR family oxidoreductase [Chloroflexota bacterium]|nr:SDR family oxidoreductase [Chloroflexota bacterium]
MKRLSGKVVIITGAGRGIGRRAALLFASEGAKLLLVDINAEAGESVAEEVLSEGGEAVFIKTDLTNAADVEAMVAAALERYGHIDVLYNNAGINHYGKLADTEESDWDKVMAVNVKSIYLTCKYVIPVMAAQNKGSIVNTGSTASLVGLKSLAVYTASKGAVLQLTRNMALDYAKDGIRVNALCPGVTATEMTQQVIDDDPDPQAARERFDRVIPRGSMADPVEIANTALFLASDEASYITGAAIPVDGGYTAG